MDDLTLDEIMRASGLVPSSAYRRLVDYRLGMISRDHALRPSRKPCVRERAEQAGAPSIEAVALATGLSMVGAYNRLLRFLKGKITSEQLLEPKHEPPPHRAVAKSKKRRNRRTNGDCSKEGDWGDLGLGPRQKIDDIPGCTPLERRVYGGGRRMIRNCSTSRNV